MDKFHFFSSRQYETKVFVISENYAPDKSRTIGVIYSRERAIAIDTGTGAVGDIRKYIEAVLSAECFVGTPYAIMSVCTSGVPENIGGTGVFDEAFIDAKDLEMAKANLSEEHRKSVLAKWSDSNPIIADYCRDMLIDESGVNFVPWDDPDILRCPGDVDNFHLGGVHIEVVPIPGATPGSIALVVMGRGLRRYIFMGESLDLGTTYLPRCDRKGLTDYLKGLKAVLAKATEDTIFFGARSAQPFDINVAHNIEQAVQDVLDGNTEGDIPAEMTFHGVKSKDDFRLHYVNNNSLLYNATLVK